jgi:hypothetical protein
MAVLFRAASALLILACALVSRAQCVAVIVASPALFQVQCRTPRQIELANAFCRYLEMATAIKPNG